MVKKEDSWKLFFSKRAPQDAKKLRSNGLKTKTEKLLDLLTKNPRANPPPFKKLVGNFEGYYSRRINIQHRLVYLINDKKREIRILSMWAHYHQN